jgi:hypothetical protein
MKLPVCRLRITGKGIAAGALMGLAVAAGTIALPSLASGQQPPGWQRDGFPDEKSWEAYMSEWSKISSTPELKEWAKSRDSAENALAAIPGLISDGLSRLSAEDLIDRQKLELQMTEPLQSQDAALCAQLSGGSEDNDGDMQRKMLAAMYKAGGESAMATWGRINEHAVIAALRKDPKPEFSDREFDSMLRTMLAPLPQQRRAQVYKMLDQPGVLPDSQACEAGIDLYKSALALPQKDRETAARMLMSD